MFHKILIANRGEIAVRIIRTCKSLGIWTVAVYSDADQDALHVRLADEAHHIGGSRVNESYLNIERLLAVAKETGAEAVHPGYGLLSENVEFAAACEANGITFIGPTRDVMTKMSSKIDARQTMIELGMPVVPGTETALADVDEAKRVAADIGYPVMLKAAAGGGGIGMQLVNDEAELAKAFESNAKRAESFFANGALYLEKAIVDPHHIEIQVLCDKHGAGIYVWERECSIQRRHQKVIEEAPSPFLSEATMQRMGQLAVKVALAIGYVNAGTFEFLVDEHENFYFLEMNTRLQVEHPVTEAISQLDLVEWQLRIAAGEQLTVSQDELVRLGHAIEVRLYAEDPKTFFPAPGQIQGLSYKDVTGVRYDWGVHEASAVTPFYDPLIAKIIAHGETREQATERLVEALTNLAVNGLKTNLPFLVAVLQSEQFASRRTTTNFIAEFFAAEKQKLNQ